MKCWICKSNEANSGEHKIKKSDLKLLYPNITQKSPIYQSLNGVKKRPIGSTNSQDFKFEKVICEDCNNSKTQKFDQSWDILSKYLNTNWSEILKNKGFNPDSVFNNKSKENLVFVQLFFLKLMGCKIKQSGKSTALQSFSDSLNTSKEHKNVYISFRDSANRYKGNHSANSDIQLFRTPDKKVKYMHWFYVVGKVTVDLIYSPDISGLDLNGALLPNQMDGFIKLSKLNYDQTYSSEDC